MHEFFLIMQKRRDGNVYADINKAVDKIFLTEHEAAEHMETMEPRGNWHVVRLIASLPCDPARPV
jgi:hypothetical protein